MTNPVHPIQSGANIPLPATLRPEGPGGLMHVPAAGSGQAFQAKLDASRLPEASVEGAGRPAGRWGIDSIDVQRTHLEKERAAVFEAYTSGKLDSFTANMRLLDLQTSIQEVAFKAELVSKLVDHAVGGAKTVLQTSS